MSKLIVSTSKLKYAFRDHGKQEALLQNSEMDYTICRAPMLSNEINTYSAVAVKEGEIPPRPVLSRGIRERNLLLIIENNNQIRETINLSNSDLQI